VIAKNTHFSVAAGGAGSAVAWSASNGYVLQPDWLVRFLACPRFWCVVGLQVLGAAAIEAPRL
jgi:hypothetical protein